MQLLSMEKFKSAASCAGETGTIEVKKLSGDARVEFFTMVEDMVMANRKKVSIPGPVMAPKPVAASEPVEAMPPAPVPTETAVVEPAKVPESEAAHGPLDAPLPKAAQENSEAPLPAPAAPVQKNSEAPPQAVPVQKNSNADLARLAELKPVEPAAPSVAEDPSKAAVPATLAPQSAALKLQPAAPDRTLELNGLQALMAAQKGREQQRESLAHAATLTPATEKLDWTTHKKEGMGLKRLMEETVQ